MTDKDVGRAGLLETLHDWQRAGLTHLPKPRLRADLAAKATHAAEPSADAGDEQTQGASAASEMTASGTVGGNSTSVSDRLAALAVVAREVAACQLCTELAAARRQTVFGVGTPTPRLVFMGEAPGADEDRQGEPFVGRAGQLLTKIIEACTLRREDVYILNTLKCRPPENRNPLPHEAANCRGFLDRQLDILKPQYICCLGAVAAQSLLGTTLSIGRLRGRFHDYRGMRVLCTYHPAYLLRSPDKKKDCWEDMQLLMREMGIALPGR
ncbi:MAG: uracil-DNA glycosylase [Planctomycetia bacterium]|nr:uracil-DNA glycosylase [Planctomycetia bacterium]